MRIDSLNTVSQLYQNNTVNRVSKVNSVEKADKVEISEKAKDYQFARQAVQNTEEIRTEKVNQIKKQMAAGTYSVSDSDIAEKLVSRKFDIKI